VINTAIESIWLDYGRAGKRELLHNLSAAAAVEGFLWTASDEGRTVECLQLVEDNYRLREQYDLDSLFPGLPGADTRDEADIESMDAAGGRLWICGSHCHVRSKPKSPGTLNAKIRTRPSRCLLGAVALGASGANLEGLGESLPFAGGRTLRTCLTSSPYIEPFESLPSKENGLDIEGMVVRGSKVFLGLRGPLVDGIALVVEIELRRGLRIRKGALVLHLLDLGGLGVRDLTRIGSDIAILAGPVGSVAGPFRIFRWRPRRTKRVQVPRQFFTWSMDDEHPEGLCILHRKDRPGLLVLYDSPSDTRIRGGRYRADWIPAPSR
jgi:Protein of unknown function (DUF3616)